MLVSQLGNPQNKRSRVGFFVSMAIETIDRLRKAIERKEEEIKAAKEVMKTAAYDYLLTLQGEDRKDAAWEIYWFYQEIPAYVIEKVYPGRGSARSIVGEAHIPATCGTCGKEFFVTITSRDDLRRHNSTRFAKFGNTCNPCKEVQNQKSTIAYREYQEQVETQLQALKTMPYAEYLQTEHWQGKRRAALRNANYRCQLCNSGGELHVHHRTYERRGEEYLKDLLVLCKDCHAKFHDKLIEVEP